MTAEGVSQPRRVIRPKYEFDPDAAYEDPQVQAWATYYAQGGADPAGSVHFIFVPGVSTRDGRQTNDEAHSSGMLQRHPSPSLTTDTNLPGQSLVSPRDSKPKSRMLGLSELLLQFSERKQAEKRLNFAPPSVVTPRSRDYDRELDSVRLRLKARVGSRLTKIFTFKNNSHTASIASPVNNSIVHAAAVADSGMDGGDDRYLSSAPLPPSYGDLFSNIEPSPHVSPNPTIVPKERFAPVEVFIEPSSPSLRSPSPSTVNRPVVSVIPPCLPKTIASENIIFRNLLSFLVNKVPAADPLRATLHEYLVTVRSLARDPISSLLQSHEYRASLLQVASALNISEDPKVREVLQTDEYEIAGLLEAVLRSEESKRAVLQLEGDDAQKFLNLVQDVLDKAYLLDHHSEDAVSRARRLLVRLSETCDKLPSSLFIEGVERVDTQATFGGGFGDVYRAMYSGKCVALKRMRIFQRDPGIRSTRRRVCKEALIWQQLKSPFVVPFLGIDAETFPSFFCMVSPWMRHGTVLKHLADHGRNGVDKRLHEIAQGLAYLHSQKVVHGDLRGSNVLINDEWQACLTDFGLTVFDDATAAVTAASSRRGGSVRWMAPELHIPQSFGLDRFQLTPETDIYAFGCVCLEVYTGRPPFSDTLHDPTVILKVIQGGRPCRPMGEGGMSDQLWKMVEMCWSHHFADRLKTEEVVELTRKLSDADTQVSEPSAPSRGSPALQQNDNLSKDSLAKCSVSPRTVSLLTNS